MPRGHPVKRFQKAALLWSVAALGEAGLSFYMAEQIPCGRWGLYSTPPPQVEDLPTSEASSLEDVGGAATYSR